MNDAQSVANAAVNLPDDQRMWVVEILLESFESASQEDPQQVADAWRLEVRRRSEELQSGNVQPISWSSIRAEGERLLDGGE